MRVGDCPQSPPVPVITLDEPFFIGRDSEACRLEQAIRARSSLAISGPAGIGKTALASAVVRRLPSGLGAHCLYFGNVNDLQDLMRQLVRSLYVRKDPQLRRQLHAEGVSALSFEHWLQGQSSSQLKGRLYRSVEAGTYSVFLDHFPPLTRAVAKVIKELFWARNTPVYLLIRDERTDHFDWFYDFFYWTDSERLTLSPLPTRAAEALVESCIARFGLARFDLAGFRKEVFKLSGQNPGAIVRMCTLAADPRYQFASRIKTKSLYIDFLMRGRDPVGRSLPRAVVRM